MAIETVFIASLILALSITGMSVKIWAEKDGRFSGGCNSKSSAEKNCDMCQGKDSCKQRK